MFLEAILYGYASNFVENLQYMYTNYDSGTNLPYHLYKTVYESAKEKEAALQKLQKVYKAELTEDDWLNQMGFQQNDPPERKTRGKDRKGGIDWYIYRERILNPLLCPFAVRVKVQHSQLIIMEDNTPTYNKDYRNLPRACQGLTGLEWPCNSPNLNLIETIWSEMKNKVKEQLGWKITAK